MILSSFKRMEIDRAVMRWSSPESVTLDVAPVALPVRRSEAARIESPRVVPVTVTFWFIAWRRPALDD
jgi:hypothetical protein